MQRKLRSIFLKYEEGSENWAHHDGHDDAVFPCQASVMISDPKEDFEGGQFYVAKKEKDTGNIQRTTVQFENKGDMVYLTHGPHPISACPYQKLDKLNGYHHGMLKVTRGKDKQLVCCN